MCRSAKGRRLVGANDDSDDANEEGKDKSVWSFGVGGHIGNGYAAYYCNSTFYCGFCGKFEADFHSSEGLVNVC